MSRRDPLQVGDRIRIVECLKGKIPLQLYGKEATVLHVSRWEHITFMANDNVERHLSREHANLFLKKLPSLPENKE